MSAEYQVQKIRIGRERLDGPSAAALRPRHARSSIGSLRMYSVGPLSVSWIPKGASLRKRKAGNAVRPELRGVLGSTAINQGLLLFSVRQDFDVL